HGSGSAWPRRLGGVDDAAGIGAADRRADPLHAEKRVMVTGHGRIERTIRVWLPVGFFLVLALLPFYWMAIASLKPNSELYSANVNSLIVYHPTLKHYVDLLSQTGFRLWAWKTSRRS